MYEVSVPIISKPMSEREKDAMVCQLKRINPTVVYLVYLRPVFDKEIKQKTLDVFKENKRFFEEDGFSVGVWVAPTIGYGGYSLSGTDSYQRIEDLDGEKVNAYCPLDDRFCEDISEQLAELAKTGVRRILLEDDFTLAGGKTRIDRMGCACERHMQRLSELLGESISKKELISYVTEGGRNKYRDAYLKLKRETLLKMARTVENAVHSVDKTVEIGFSANSASYHLEGVDALELARTVAGENKPFMRITAAPYWKNGPTLNSIIECARLQNVWCRENGIDAMTEGDTYPRPRYMVSSAYLEMYDTALRADGNSKGILKYMLDYTSRADFETGYVDRHVLNSEVYAEIEKRFSGLKTVGLEVFEKPFSIGNVDFDDKFRFNDFTSHGTLPLLSQWFVTDNSIPTTYESSDGSLLVFGDNARYLSESELSRGLIIDVKAAEILKSKGVDVGFEDFEPAEKPCGEYFYAEEDATLTLISGADGFYRFRLNKGAEVLSSFYKTAGSLGVAGSYTDRDDSYPSCYYYENEKGQRFAVYTFSPCQTKTNSEWAAGVFKNYYRQKQLAAVCRRLAGKPLPAVCTGNPGLYVLCKSDGARLAVGLWNIFPDEILKPVITVDGEYKSIDAYNCCGKICGNEVILDSAIAPYSFVCFTLEK